MKDNLLNDFCIEVARNRSALLFKNFEESWLFLGLNPLILKTQQAKGCKQWYENVFQFHFIIEVLKDCKNNEIFLHQKCKINNDDFLYALENISLKNNKTWNTATPYLSTKIFINNEKLRLTLIHPKITSDGLPKAFVRRLQAKPIDLEHYTPHQLLKKLIKNKKNIIISGSTGSGKTTLIQSLLSNCPEDEHLVILEDTHEIYLDHKNTTQLISDENNSLIDYCSYTLRISPERIILGELRGEEVLPLMLAMNTGHNGFLSTIHSNSAASTLQRLRTLLEFFSPVGSSCFQMVCQNIDIVIHMENKKIVEIIKVIGVDENIPLYEYLFRNEPRQCRVAA